MDNSCGFQMIPTEKINLDFDNPRIKHFTEMYGDNLQPENIYLALNVGARGEGDNAPTFQSLEQSIRTHGRIIHPIIVNTQVDGKLVVIEGNTRVAIYRRFQDKGYEGEWNLIPAMVYNNLSQSEIDAIRLQSHLVGPRPWDPYSKAKYLYFLRNTKHLTMAQIVDYCGGRQREVLTYLAAYEDMEEYYRSRIESDDQFDTSRFSAFVELQKPNVRKSIIGAGFTYYDFADWVIKLLIHPLNTVRKLPQILADKKTKKIFLSEGAREAIKILDAPIDDDILKGASLETLACEISRRIRSIQYRELKQLREEQESPKVINLMEARDELVGLCEDIMEE